MIVLAFFWCSYDVGAFRSVGVKELQSTVLPLNVEALFGNCLATSQLKTLCGICQIRPFSFETSSVSVAGGTMIAKNLGRERRYPEKER